MNQTMSQGCKAIIVFAVLVTAVASQTEGKDESSLEKLKVASLAECLDNPECASRLPDEDLDEARQKRSNDGYLLRTRKEDSNKYLLRVRRSGQHHPGESQVRNRKGGYLFRTRKSVDPLEEIHFESPAEIPMDDDDLVMDALGKRGEYLFRTRKSSYDDSEDESNDLDKRREYLFRTRKALWTALANNPIAGNKRGEYLFRTRKSDNAKRGEYLFRTRKGGYLFRTRKDSPWWHNQLPIAHKSRRDMYLFRT